MSGTLVVEVHDLEKRYKRGTVQALAGVSFGVERGEVFGYLGRNGAGKSTTVRILTTLLRPTAGRALVGGFDVYAQPEKARRVLGAALQDAALDDLMTGREHLVLAARLTGLSGAASKEKADELLEVFGLAGAADRIAANYSGGMRRRLDVAMAMVRRPEILFLDEPTAGLDPQGRRTLWAIVRELRDQGSTVFLTSQYLAEVDEIASRVAILHDGLLSAMGTPDDLKARFGGATTVTVRAANSASVWEATTKYQRTRSDDGLFTLTVDGGDAAVARLIAGLVTAGVAIEYLRVHPPTLEDVFVNVTGGGIDTSVGSGDKGSIAALRRGMAPVSRVRL